MSKTKTPMEHFFMREPANTGIDLPLYLPTGEKTEHSLRILGVDSDIFRAAEADWRRQALRIAEIESEDDRRRESDEAQLDLIASLVVDWTFDQPCTRENVKNFLREAPQIAKAVDRAAAQRSLFFAARLKNSLPSQKQPSDSTKGQKGPSKP